MRTQETSFQQAKAEFQGFLSANNLSTEIVWIFREDVFCLNSKEFTKDFWLKNQLVAENERFAKKVYEIGQKKGLGICLLAFANYEDKICCCLILPKDREDSEYLFMSPKELKFSFVNEMPIAKTLNSSIRWQIFRLLTFKYKQGCYINYLPSKAGQ